MKTAKTTLFITFIGLTLSACAAHRAESTVGQKLLFNHAPEYAVVLAPMTSVTISDARAYQDGEQFVVAGRVKRLHEVHLPGHLDLAICDSDGNLLAQEKTRILGLSSKRKGSMDLPFRFQLGIVPPKGATIRLRYHPSASDNPEWNCMNS
ncbi:MAG TPA: hypothetical protein VJ995_07685 [Geothermobacteraceae bacterium]|nr:hypothetical protein [Geothermobacteraceae bacterium]